MHGGVGVVVLLLLHLPLLSVTLGFACMVLLLVTIEAQHLAGREDGGKSGAKSTFVAVRDADVGIHDSVDVCILPSKIIGGLEWRPPTAILWPGRPDRDAHRLVHALAGDSAGWGCVHEVDMELWLGLGHGSKRGGRTRATCLCGRHRAYWEIDGANEGEVLAHVGDHLACLVGCVGVIERGESCDRIDGHDDENAGFERSSVESFIVVQPMGHRAQGRGYQRRAEGRWRRRGWGRGRWNETCGQTTASDNKACPVIIFQIW